MSGAQVFGLLGFAQAAGQVESGRIAAEKALARGQARLLILAEDAGGDVNRRILMLAEQYAVPCFCFARKSELGQAIGRPDRSVISINDTRFSARLKTLLVEGGCQPVKKGGRS